MHYIEAVNKREVGYQYHTNNVITDITYGLLFLLVYTEVVLIFRVYLVVYSKLGLV